MEPEIEDIEAAFTTLVEALSARPQGGGFRTGRDALGAVLNALLASYGDELDITWSGAPWR